MRAVVVRGCGNPASVAVVDGAEAEPGPGEVVVRAEAMGVGYVDVMASRGLYAYFPGPGSSPGLEVAGVVESTGPGVPPGLVGQRVLGLPAFGGLAEAVAVSADRVLPLDDGMEPDVAVALGVNALVAEIGLGRAGIGPDGRVLVRGAGGGIGALATQIAAAHGAHVTAVTSGPDRARALLASGATRTVGRDEAPALERDVDIVVDTVGGPELADHLRLLAPNGHYLLCGAAGGVPSGADLEVIVEMFHSSPTLHAFSLNSVGAADLRASWARVSALVGTGKVTGIVAERYPLAAGPEALRAVERGGAFGKVVLHP
ncbi:zinc-binding dehydrogenase [Pseudonocardia sp. ICBG1293]|uniref:quinone oxidoreductase family protein n=1 Tax=Pseudonocardia sp. ICBG1293 TaxID=2844382 RepID=UPI001CCAD82F|nr:zinc-binding dehydrogenase [Pseudonocardia sp. ICBG1293]